MYPRTVCSRRLIADTNQATPQCLGSRTSLRLVSSPRYSVDSAEERRCREPVFRAWRSNNARMCRAPDRQAYSIGPDLSLNLLRRIWDRHRPGRQCDNRSVRCSVSEQSNGRPVLQPPEHIFNQLRTNLVFQNNINRSSAFEQRVRSIKKVSRLFRGFPNAQCDIPNRCQPSNDHALRRA